VLAVLAVVPLVQVVTLPGRQSLQPLVEPEEQDILGHLQEMHMAAEEADQVIGLQVTQQLQTQQVVLVVVVPVVLPADLRVCLISVLLVVQEQVEELALVQVYHRQQFRLPEVQE
jgi:hypothetical protein